MNHPDLDSSLPDWVIEFPQAVAIFERWGLDYSCGGKSLDFACRERGLDPHGILRELQNLACAPQTRRPMECSDKQAEAAPPPPSPGQDQ